LQCKGTVITDYRAWCGQELQREFPNSVQKINNALKRCSQVLVD